MGKCYHRKVLYICKYDGVKYFKHAQKDPPFEAVCENCRMVMSLGHSYDSPSEVKIEILAAEVGQNADVWRRFVTNDGDVAADLERIGAFPTLELGTSSIYAHHAYLDPPPRWTRWEMNDYWSGWLAREMASERDAPDAWPWDITRPVAGQYEEQQLKRFQEIRDERIAEQTRHDVAASVARHADLPGRVQYEDLIALHNETCDARDEPQYKVPGLVEVELAIGADPDDGDPPPLVLDPAYEAERAAEPDCRDE